MSRNHFNTLKLPPLTGHPDNDRMLDEHLIPGLQNASTGSPSYLLQTLNSQQPQPPFGNHHSVDDMIMDIRYEPYTTPLDNDSLFGTEKMPDETALEDDGTTVESPISDPQVSGNPLLRQSTHKNGKPKRPLNAFMIFGRDRRPKLLKERPKIAVGEIAKELGKEWAVMPAVSLSVTYFLKLRLSERRMRQEEKDKYVQAAKVVRDNFHRVSRGGEALLLADSLEQMHPGYIYHRRSNNMRAERSHRKRSGSAGGSSGGETSAGTGDERNKSSESTSASATESDRIPARRTRVIASNIPVASPLRSPLSESDMPSYQAQAPNRGRDSAYGAATASSSNHFPFLSTGQSPFLQQATSHQRNRSGSGSSFMTSDSDSVMFEPQTRMQNILPALAGLYPSSLPSDSMAINYTTTDLTASAASTGGAIMNHNQPPLISAAAIRLPVLRTATTPSWQAMAHQYRHRSPSQTSISSDESIAASLSPRASNSPYEPAAGANSHLPWDAIGSLNMSTPGVTYPFQPLYQHGEAISPATDIARAGFSCASSGVSRDFIQATGFPHTPSQQTFTRSSPTILSMSLPTPSAFGHFRHGGRRNALGSSRLAPLISDGMSQPLTATAHTAATLQSGSNSAFRDNSDSSNQSNLLHQEPEMAGRASTWRLQAAELATQPGRQPFVNNGQSTRQSVSLPRGYALSVETSSQGNEVDEILPQPLIYNGTGRRRESPNTSLEEGPAQVGARKEKTPIPRRSRKAPPDGAL